MVDSIHIRISKEKLSIRQINKLERLITNTKTIKHHLRNNVTKLGTYKNFQIAINTKTICINGSLPKFYLGSNVQTLTREQLRSALKQLSNELGIPVLRGEIARIDVAQCFPLSYPIAHYFNSLLDTPKYERDRRSNGVRYKRGEWVLAFYDKTADTARSAQVISSYRNQETMRIELRLMKNVRKTLFKKNRRVPAAYLLSDMFNNKLEHLWYKHYYSILKRRSIFSPVKMNGWNDCKKYLVSYAIHQIKMTSWNEQVNLFSTENNWTTDTKSEVKRQSLEAWNNSLTTEPNKYIEDLETKIEQVRQSRTHVQFLQQSLPASETQRNRIFKG